jgi:hypothetical protein
MTEYTPGSAYESGYQSRMNGGFQAIITLL